MSINFKGRMLESIKYQLHQLEYMARGDGELQKKVSQFVMDSIHRLEELEIDPIYSSRLLGILVSGYPAIPISEDNAKWKEREDGCLEHFLCNHVIKDGNIVYNEIGYVFFEPNSSKGILDKKYSRRPIELPCEGSSLEPIYLRLDYKLSEKSLEEQIKELKHVSQE